MTTTWTHVKEKNCEVLRGGICEHHGDVPGGGDVEGNTESPSVKTRREFQDNSNPISD